MPWRSGAHRHFPAPVLVCVGLLGCSEDGSETREPTSRPASPASITTAAPSAEPAAVEPPAHDALPDPAAWGSIEGMAEVPAGPFIMGCDPGGEGCADDSGPARRVTLAAFHIDVTEVTVGAYRRCVDAGACSAPKRGPFCSFTDEPERVEEHPINCVHWSQAAAYCHWAGKRLPTEAEWEKAARSEDGRLYPWGSEPATCARAVIAGEEGPGCGRGSSWPVGTMKGDMSPYGVHDLAGNVSEWVLDGYAPDTYAHAAATDPRGPKGAPLRVVRGGQWWRTPPHACRTTSRQDRSPDDALAFRGFRCARPAS